ncbi:hypothetical protein PESHB5_07210 [Pediococcus parvulus]
MRTLIDDEIFPDNCFITQATPFKNHYTNTRSFCKAFLLELVITFLYLISYSHHN